MNTLDEKECRETSGEELVTLPGEGRPLRKGEEARSAGSGTIRQGISKERPAKLNLKVRSTTGDELGTRRERIFISYVCRL